MESSYPIRDDQPSSSNSVLDYDPPSHMLETEPGANLLPERLTRLARLASENARLPKDDSITVNHCLDTLESLLDPRPRLTQEVTRCRPLSIHLGNVKPVTPHLPFDTPTTTKGHDNEAPHPKLAVLLNEITALNIELGKRREESFHIYSLFTRERQGMAQRISELEDEVHELQIDILEDSAEREGLEGTVCGLVSWVDGWQKQHDMLVMSRASQRNGRRRWTKRKTEEQNGSDSEALLEGISAWMRGWKDVEEGFRIRTRKRKLRREERQRQRVSAGGSTIPGAIGI